MALRDDLVPIVRDGLKALGGSATIKELAKHIYIHHEKALKASGDDYYIWQYEMRWAAQQLVDRGELTKKPRGTWRLL
ncbi:hypothetical protein FIU89_18085 [Roseovarius sp. THAF27]|uniref:hypothetical protein n=1 Tax=Roseovarius sp. THAF27 TaxID=2587850 RepID=UPI001267AE19|nr:hypothetical protein [Roseovarius sp. THAF27]QFT82541.1 hypothetical protein FIU89_18085 [Roseovarius sp. THAF27]